MNAKITKINSTGKFVGLQYLVKARKSILQYFETTFGTTVVSIGENVVPFVVHFINILEFSKWNHIWKHIFV